MTLVSGFFASWANVSRRANIISLVHPLSCFGRFIIMVVTPFLWLFKRGPSFDILTFEFGIANVKVCLQIKTSTSISQPSFRYKVVRKNPFYYLAQSIQYLLKLNHNDNVFHINYPSGRGNWKVLMPKSCQASAFLNIKEVWWDNLNCCVEFCRVAPYRDVT